MVFNVENMLLSLEVFSRSEGFPINGQTVELTYDSPCTALDMSLTKVDATFNGWTYNNATYTSSSLWNVADNVTLEASWTPKEQVTITFINHDGTSFTRTVLKGGSLEDVPAPLAKTGYTVSWDTSDFSNINEDMTVRSVEVAKSYTVNLNPNGGQLTVTSLTVTYDQPYTLEKPVHAENSFVSWLYNDQKVSLTGIWNIDSESGIVNLVAEYGDSDWTGYY